MQITFDIARLHVSPLRLALMKAAARRAALPFAVSRLGLLIVTAIASGSILPDLTRWRFWDGAFYSGIATNGYTHPGWYAWFPLWPLIQRVASRPFAVPSAHPSWPAFYAGFLLANLLCFAAGMLLEQFAPVRPHALPVSALLFASPFAFFLAAPYTESLFLLLALGVFLALRREQFGWAVGCAALASATHPTGVVLAVPILIAWLQTRGLTWRVLPIAVVSCAGLLAYMMYCLLRTGDVLAFAHAETLYQSRALTWPWQTVILVAHSGVSLQLVANSAVVALTCIALIVGAHRLPLAQTAYATLSVLPAFLIPTLGTVDPLAADGRYMLVAFPVFLLLHRAGQGHPRLTALFIAVSVLAQAGLAFFELRHGWLP